MTAPYTQAEAGRDRLDEQIATTAGNMQRLAEEVAVEAAELGRLAAAGAPLSAQARRLTDCLQGVARGAARHDALTDAVKAVYGNSTPEAPTLTLPGDDRDDRPFRGDRLVKLSRAEVQNLLHTRPNESKESEDTAR